MRTTKYLLVLSAVIFVPAFPGTAEEITYAVTAVIDPPSGGIHCTVTIRNPPGNRFYLNDRFVIRRALVDGSPATFHRDPAAGGLAYTVGTAVILDTSDVKELTLEYLGVLSGVINGVNMIRGDLVELAYYAAWLPLFPDRTLFSFSLEANLPSGYTVVTNGKLVNSLMLNGRSVTRWTSFTSDYDVVCIAAPHMKVAEDTVDNGDISLYYGNLPSSYIASKKERLKAGLEMLTGWFGSPRVSGVLRFVYSPRGGWGYSRMPLFVVSEDYTRSLMDVAWGVARDAHGAFHEMAHFWWSIAGTDSPDDWINEGLAEYSAFRLSRCISGTVFADTLMTEYRAHAAAARTYAPIAETVTDSPDRYVNRYEKTTLMLIGAARRYGEDALDRMLRELHLEYSCRRGATTEHFLDMAERLLGRDARDYFRDILYQRGWDGRVR